MKSLLIKKGSYDLHIKDSAQPVPFVKFRYLFSPLYLDAVWNISSVASIIQRLEDLIGSKLDIGVRAVQRQMRCRSERCRCMQKRTKIVLRFLLLPVFCKRWSWERLSWLADPSGRRVCWRVAVRVLAATVGSANCLFILSHFSGPAGRHAQSRLKS